MAGFAAVVNRRVAPVAALLLGGCSGSMSGVVQDAATGNPVPGAVVELKTLGWGWRNGQLVWDAETIIRTTTGTGGRFTLEADGGTGLLVTSPAGERVETSPCPRSPMIVRFGGPNAQRKADRLLLFGAVGERGDGPAGASAETLGVRGSGSAFGDGHVLVIEATGGVRFVEGTGAIPPAPPLPYERAVELDTRSDCGWLFVADGTSPIAAVKVGRPAWAQSPGAERQYMLLYAPLSAAGTASQ